MSAPTSPTEPLPGVSPVVVIPAAELTRGTTIRHTRRGRLTVDRVSTRYYEGAAYTSVLFTDGTAAVYGPNNPTVTTV